MALLRKVKKSIAKYGLLTPGDRVLVAVSGGPDSVALLQILYELRKEFSLCLEVAHLQHGIRGADAAGDARFVRELCERLGVPSHVKEISVPRIRARTGKGNLEALARAERYRFFAEVATQRNLNRIATAHTQDDRAETVLMWLFRGSGRKGLGGMAPRIGVNFRGSEPSKDLAIIRPLLEISKAEILSFLSERLRDFRLDRSNEDTGYLRNWIRRELMPQLETRMGPNLPVRLAKLAEVSAEEEYLLDSLARAELARTRVKASLQRAALLSQPKALQRRILRLWIEEARGHLQGLDFDHIESLLVLVSEAAPQGRLCLPGGWEFIKEYGYLKLAKATRQEIPLNYTYPIVIDGETGIPEVDVKIHSQCARHAPFDVPTDHWEAMFDLAALTAPLVVRNFRPGDRYQPLGMAGHRKIKDLFIEKKVPLRSRSAWPLVVMGNEILWLPGLGRSETGKITSQTRQCVRIRVDKRDIME